ncbi:MAG: ferredoxin--NADP reductase [Bacteroidota bacterium]
MTVYTLKVVQIKQETDDAVTLCFKQPALRKIKYTAGQYLTLVLRINGRRYVRPYSFSSCPETDPFLEVTVKKVFNGIVSNHIIDFIKEGDSIEALSPLGDFCHNFDSDVRGVYLWGVGSGITPLFSILKSLLFKERELRIHLIYGNRNNESTIFLNQIKILQEKHPDQLIVKYFYTQDVIDKTNPGHIQGRINQTTAESILKEDPLLLASCHYICGPAGLKESVIAALKSCKVSEHKIYSEDFELVKNPKDFEGINTQLVRVKFQGEVKEIEVTKGRSILEAALEADIELPYSCQTGNCSVCKGKLLSGSATMIGLSKGRTDLAEDEFLLCCSHPQSSEVYIEV